MTTKVSKKHTQKEHCIDSSLTFPTKVYVEDKKTKSPSYLICDAISTLGIGDGGHAKILPNGTKNNCMYHRS